MIHYSDSAKLGRPAPSTSRGKVSIEPEAVDPFTVDPFPDDPFPVVPFSVVPFAETSFPADERFSAALLSLARSKVPVRGGLHEALSETFNLLQQHFAPAEPTLWLRMAGSVSFNSIHPATSAHASMRQEAMLEISDADVSRLLNDLDRTKVRRHRCYSKCSQGQVPNCNATLCGGGASLASAVWENGNIVGILYLEHPDATHVWERDESLFFSALADYVSHTLERIGQQKLVSAERARLESQVRKAGRFETLAVLAGSIVHDFNNLILVIEGNAKLALTKIANATSPQTHVERIYAASARARELSNRLLSYSGKRTLSVAPVQLSSLVEEMVSLLDTVVGENAPIQLQLAQNLPLLLADAAQLGQVVMNLITNAVDALQGKRGAITIVTRACSLDAEFLCDCILGEKAKPGDFVMLEVSDTGIGMDADTLTRIFDPFFTTKPFGRGLGLPGVLGVIRNHHGALHVQTVPWDGTTIQVFFPVRGE